MTSRFDFQDALEDLLHSRGAVLYESLSVFRGKEIQASIYFLAKQILGSAMPHSYVLMTRKLVDNFKSIGATIRFVDSGIEYMSKEQSAERIFQVSHIVNRFFYFKMISMTKRPINEVDKKFFEQNDEIRRISSNDTFGVYSFKVIHEGEFVPSVEKGGAKIMRAPQSEINQLLYFGQSGNFEIIHESPVFLISDLTSIYCDVDFDLQRVKKMDLTLLAQSFSLSTQMLRKCLLGALVYFQFYPKMKDQVKYIDSFKDSFAKFEKEYYETRISILNLLIEQILFLSSHFSSPNIDDTFLADLKEFYGFDISSMDEFTSFLFNCSVLTNAKQVHSFPKNIAFKSRKYLLDDLHSQLVFHFTRYEIPEEIIYLLTKCHEHKLIFRAPKLEFVELHYANEVYFKEHLEWALAQYLSLYPLDHDTELSFKYFNQDPVKLKISEAVIGFKLPGYQLQTAPTILNFLYQFYLFIQDNQNAKIERAFDFNEINDFLFYLNITILHRLKYLDIQQRCIFIPAAAFVKACPKGLEEELILVFELIRHNLLMENLVVEKFPIFKNFDKFVQNNKFDEILYNESVCTAFMKNFEQKSIPNKNTQNSSDLLLSAFDLSDQSEGELYSIIHERPENLKIGLMKSLTIFYRAIKEFQYDYQRFYQLENASLKAEFILSRAFEQVPLPGLLICSRIFCFLVTDFTITDFYAYDFFHFLPLVLTVQKSIRMIVDACKVHLYNARESGFDSCFNERLEAELPFRNNYSVDAGKLTKMLLTKFLIFEALIEENDLFAKEYAEQLSPSYLTANFHIPFVMQDFLKKGKALIEMLEVFLKTTQQMSESHIYNNILEHLPFIKSILERMLNFYEGDSQLNQTLI